MQSRFLLRITYLTGFIFSFQVALTSYVNSSFLATKIPESTIGLLYTASAVVSIIGMFLVPRVVNKIGTKPLLGFFAFANILNILGLILATTIPVIAICFIFFFSFTTLIFLTLDILVESWSNHATQGTVRGVYLTSMNVGFMIAPLLGGFITDRLGFSGLYHLAVFLIAIGFFIILFLLPNITATHTLKNNFFAVAKKFINNKNLGSVFIINFILQFFYAWMVIYAPIYLHEQVGIHWDVIGTLFSIMLSAFVLFQFITGKITDRYHCEKPLMIIGLTAMGIATLWVTRAPLLTFWGLAAVLFVTRFGASIIEVVTESYFFSHIHADDTGSIGFFRNTYPFAYIIAPLVAGGIIHFFPMWTLFIILGIICFCAILIVLPMKKVPPLRE